MDFQELIERARYIKGRNAEMTAAEGNTPWGAAERFQGLVGDVGDLAKLVMAKNGFPSRAGRLFVVGHYFG